MAKLYTIDDHGEITSGLTAIEAADILLRDDSCEYEIRKAAPRLVHAPRGDGFMRRTRGYGYYELWTRQQVANKPWTKTVIGVVAHRMSAKVEREIAEKVIRSGHWERGELACRTDEQHAAMMAQLAADEAAANG